MQLLKSTTRRKGPNMCCQRSNSSCALCQLTKMKTPDKETMAQLNYSIGLWWNVQNFVTKPPSSKFATPNFQGTFQAQPQYIFQLQYWPYWIFSKCNLQVIHALSISHSSSVFYDAQLAQHVMYYLSTACDHYGKKLSLHPQFSTLCQTGYTVHLVGWLLM
jgi:hypothetical protein